MKRVFCFSTLLLIALAVQLAHAQSSSPSTKDSPDQLFKLLDGNRDGNLDPYEALDVLMQMESEFDGQAISSKRIAGILKEIEQDELAEISEMLSEMDVNEDGKITLTEMDQDMRGFAQMLDKNEDGVITAAEVRDADFEDEMFMSAEEIEDEVDGLFEAFDANEDGNLTQDEADEDEFSWSQMSEGDSNRDGKVTKSEMVAFFTSDNQRAQFKIVDDTAVMSGVICADTPAKVLRLAFEHPSVRTIVMANVPGSIDDEANLRAARYVRKFGFTTKLESIGIVASGGTDFFLAGKTRTYAPGAKFGIHSWGGPGFQGKDVPRDNPQHQLYLKYYEEMGTPVEFYWRTLEAAPANDIHWMTEEELLEFKFQTTDIQANQSQVGDDIKNNDEESEGSDEILKELDTDGDGKLQRKELPNDAKDQFDDIDQNGDGFIDRNELEQVFDNDDDARDDNDSSDHPTADPRVTSEEIKTLDSQTSIDTDTKWNLEQMAERCEKIAENAQGYYEATFPEGHVLVFIPQGSFEMGTNTLNGLDKPVHQVGLRGFWIGKFLVTNAQFKTFVDDTNFKTDAEKDGVEGPYVYNFKERYFKPTPGRTWRDAFEEYVDDHPVVAVSWYDSQTYSKWLGQKLDLDLQLPSEAQWEKAARGTDGRRFPWGNDAPDGTQCNFCDVQFSKVYPRARQGNPDLNSDDGYPGLSPVAAFPNGASPYGVFDMGGNVSNWVADWIGQYPDFEVIDPQGPSRGGSRCMRGGFWVADAGLTKASIREQHNCRSECRSADDPYSSDDHLGFRFAVQFSQHGN